jgi:hypothetical protein
MSHPRSAFASGRPIILGAVLAVAAAPAWPGDQIYRSVDKNGQPVFSDQPRTDSAPVSLPPTNTLPPTAAPESGTPAREEEAYYASIAITSPANDESFTNTGGEFAVSAQIDPPLRDGDALQLLVDGTAYGPTQTEGQFAVSGYLHGTHTLQVQVIDATGATLLESGTISVHMHQTNSRTQKPLRRRTN